ncbi:MAG: HD domain-containing protein, partial [Desulfuromonadales bacterium]|nr:HD domain-containing protein [Desulfuromonadales bacterium]
KVRVASHLRLRALQQRLEEQNQTLEKTVNDQVRQIEDAQMATIFSMARLSESRDSDTGEHLVRVMEYCRVLSQELGRDSAYADVANNDFVANVTSGSVLHDIGKVAISDAVMLKPGRLTLGERKEMEQHAQIGAETLEAVLQQHPDNTFIRTGIDIARSHHEHWDGTGYPQGLVGENIPLAARIMRVADVYDALSSKRCYKDSWSHEETCKEIISLSGVEFDPELIMVFRRVQEQFHVISERSLLPNKKLETTDDQHKEFSRLMMRRSCGDNERPLYTNKA